MSETDPARLTTEQIVAAEGAKRLLADPIFNGAIDEVVRDATQKAIILDDPVERENNRHLVLALGRFRGSLEAAVEFVESAKTMADRAKSFE
jgi:hypothetical protein